MGQWNGPTQDAKFPDAKYDVCGASWNKGDVEQEGEWQLQEEQGA